MREADAGDWSLPQVCSGEGTAASPSLHPVAGDLGHPRTQGWASCSKQRLCSAGRSPRQGQAHANGGCTK